MDSWITSTPVDHEVRGRTLQFYPLTLKSVLKLKGVAGSVAKPLAVLFGGGGEPIVGVVEKAILTPEGKPSGGPIERTIAPIEPALSKARADQRERAVAALVEALLDPAFARAVSDLLLDSLRGKVPDLKADFLLECDAATAKEFLAGLAKANKDLVNPFVEGLATRLRPTSPAATAGTT